MNKKNCREALEIYKKFLERTDSVAAFLKVAEVRNIKLLKEVAHNWKKKLREILFKKPQFLFV